MNIRSIFFSLLFLSVAADANAQVKMTNDSILKAEPEFYKHYLSISDPLFDQDIQKINKVISLDSNALQLLRPPVLYAIMKTQVDLGYPPTFATLKTCLSQFFLTPAYHDFVQSTLLYKKIAKLYVEISLWPTVKPLFVQLGFTPADLEDFIVFLDTNKLKKWTYQQAYESYLAEMYTLK